MQAWLDDAKQHCDPTMTVCLVGNKIDLPAPRQVATEEARAYAEANGLLFFEVSAATGANVEDVFTQSAAVVYQKITEGNLSTATEHSGVKAVSPTSTPVTVLPAPKSPGSAGAAAGAAGAGADTKIAVTNGGCCS